MDRMKQPPVVVKNTFLEVGDHKSLYERSDGWRRQMSEPAPSGFNQDLSELDDDDDEEDGIDGAAASLGAGAVADLGAAAAALGLGRAAAALAGTAAATDVPCASNQAYAPRLDPAQLLGLVSPSGQAGIGGAPARGACSSRTNGKGDGAAEGGRWKDAVKDNRINNVKDISVTQKEPPWDDVTTVMMRNLPNKYTQQMLLDELQDAGFKLQTDVDFFYLPMDHANAANLGYCFINFVRTEMANAFASAFQGRKMRRFNSNKTIVVMPASIQGYEKNYDYYSSTRVAQAEDPAYRPLFVRHNSVPSGPRQPSSNAKGGKKGGFKSKGEGKGPASWQAPADPSSQAPNRWAASGMGAAWAQPEAPWPAPPPPAQAPQQLHLAPHVPVADPRVQRFCPMCGAEVNPSHKFCPFCGAAKEGPGPGGGHQQQPQQPSRPPQHEPGLGLLASRPLEGGYLGTAPGAAWHGVPAAPAADWQHMLRPPGPGRQPLATGPTAPAMQGLMDLAPTDCAASAVHDELDVFRGRQMLLAALQEMEQRERDVPAAAAPPPMGGFYATMPATGGPSQADPTWASRDAGWSGGHVVGWSSLEAAQLPRGPVY